MYPALRADRQAAGVQYGSLNLPLNDEILVGDQIALETQGRPRSSPWASPRAAPQPRLAVLTVA